MRVNLSAAHPPLLRPRLWARHPRALAAAFRPAGRTGPACTSRRPRQRRCPDRRAGLGRDARAAPRGGRAALEAVDHRIRTAACQRARRTSRAGAARDHRSGGGRGSARVRAGGARGVGAPQPATRHLRNRPRGRSGDRGARAGPRAARVRGAWRVARHVGGARSGAPAHRRAERAEARCDRPGRGQGRAAGGCARDGARRGGGQGDPGARPGKLGRPRRARARNDDHRAGAACRCDPGRHRGRRGARRRGVVRAESRHHLRSPAPRGSAPDGADRDRGSSIRPGHGLAERARRAHQGGDAAARRGARRCGSLALEGRAPAGTAHRSTARRAAVAAARGRLRGAARHAAGGRARGRWRIQRDAPLGAGPARRRFGGARRGAALRVPRRSSGVAARDHAAARRAPRRSGPHRSDAAPAGRPAGGGDGAVRAPPPRGSANSGGTGGALPGPAAARSLLRPLGR